MSADAIPAATLVLLRDRAAAPPELLVVERAASMAFAAGALVFPGGRVDEGDRALAARFDIEPDDAAARIAAVRETIEESGLAVALDPVPDAASVARLRAGLHAGAPFAALLDDARASLDLAALTPFARWRPNFKETRTFDTRFYIARAAPGTPDPAVDATENVSSFWASAADILAACDRGERRVIFPTRRNLERLATLTSHADAVAHARAHAVATITPWIEERAGGAHLCIPDGHGYPVLSEPLADAMRG